MTKQYNCRLYLSKLKNALRECGLLVKCGYEIFCISKHGFWCKGYVYVLVNDIGVSIKYIADKLKEDK